MYESEEDLVKVEGPLDHLVKVESSEDPEKFNFHLPKQENSSKIEAVDVDVILNVEPCVDDAKGSIIASPWTAPSGKYFEKI